MNDDKVKTILELIVLGAVLGLFLWAPSKNTLAWLVFLGGIAGVGITIFELKNEQAFQLWRRWVAGGIMILGLFAGHFSSPFRIIGFPFLYYGTIAFFILLYVLLPSYSYLSSIREILILDLILLLGLVTILIIVFQ